MRQKIWQIFMNQKFRTFLAVIFSIYCTVTLSNGFLLYGNSLIHGRSMEAIIFCIMFFIVCRYCFSITNKRKTIVAIIVADIIACLLYIGAEFDNYHTVLIPDFSLINCFLGFWILIWCGVILLFKIMDKFEEERVVLQCIWIKKNFKGNNRSFLLFWFGLIVIWIPVFLAVYPGIYSYDASLQILEIYGKWGLSSHHPVIHTLFLNGCLSLGDFLFNNYNTGIVIYSIIQGSIIAAAFANVCNKMVEYHVNRLIVVGTFVWFAFNPINQIFAFLTTKDVLFTAFFVWCIVLTVEMTIDEQFFKKKKKVVEFFVSAVFMILFRNQGKYIFIFFVMVDVICFKETCKKFLLLSILIIATTQIITGPVSTLAGVQEGSVREALSVPLQQLARVYNMRPDYYTEKDLILLHGLIPKEGWESYEPEIADPVKGGFNNEFWSKNKLELGKLWIRTGIDNFMTYVESFLYGAYGYWYVDSSPRVQAYIWFDGFFMEPEYNILNISRNSKLENYEQYLREISYNLIYEKIPIIAVILNQGFPFMCMMISAGYIFYMKRYRLFGALIWMFAAWGIILLGPVICVRYAYPLIAAVPTLGLVAYAYKSVERYE